MANVTHIYGNEVTDAAARGSLAPAYSASSTYAVGDIVLHEGQLYECSTAINTAEEWTAAHWTAKTVADEVSSLKGGLTDIQTATSGDIGKALSPKTVSSGKVTEWKYVSVGGGGSVDLNYVTPEEYGAEGDGITDDSQAVQDAVDAGYAVYFEDGKTYYLASSVTIDHDCYLFGGGTIKTKTPSGGTVNDGIIITGTLKDTTTLTSNYYTVGTTSDANRSNQLTLDDMSNVEIGDILVIKATDQYYSYSRQYYYLGGTFKVVDKYDGHIYINRNMPFDIELTNSVSVAVYSAPSATVENLHFVSDLDSFGSVGTYPALLTLSYCKDSNILNCTFDHMKVGVSLLYSVNTLCDNVQLAKSRYDNSSGLSDGYGIYVYSDTNSVFRRIVSLCSQGCIDMSGDIPNFDTYIKECDLASECRNVGLDMHDNSYNLVVEDCVVAGLSIYGTAIINRCHFVRNIRSANDNSINDFGISLKGSHDPRWAVMYVTNCVFDYDVANYLTAQTAQSSIQAINSVIGKVVFEHCKGGKLTYNPPINSYILSNTLNELVINDWDDCYEIYHTENGTIKNLVIDDSSFVNRYYLNKHTGAITTDGIKNIVVRRALPSKNVLFANLDDTFGARYTLPEGIGINVASSDSSAVYTVCGQNLASDDSTDYSAGSVAYTVGNAFTRTKDNTYTGFISDDDAGSLIYSVASGYSSNKQIYPNAMIYVDTDENMILTVSATVKNTGSTNGTSFRMYIVLVDPDTGKITYSNSGTGKTASVGGETITHTKEIQSRSIIFWYIHSYDVVGGSVTKIENPMVSLTNYDSPVPSYKPFTANKRTGDGVLQSIEGQNTIMSTAETFDIDFNCDYVAEPIGCAPSAKGVSF